MARRPCSVSITCNGIGPQPEPDWPVTNYSAEAPDPLIFAAISYPQIGTEPIGCFYTVGCAQALSVSCHGVTYSAESQEQADALALAASIYCPSTDTGSEGAIYSNDAATATLKCPNGTEFTYTVEAGTMVSGLLDDVVGAAWKEAANQWAQAYAMQMAAELMTCVEPSRKGSGGPASNLAGNPGYACIGETLLPEENTYAVGNPSGRTFVFSISGTLPPGVTFSQASPTACELSGTPTTAGIFTFTITAVSTALPTISLSVTDVFYIPGITNLTLADGIEGGDYGPEQLLTSGTVAPVTFALAPGSTMPDGLALHPGGMIDGTPSAAGDYTFNVVITDADGRECTQEVSITIASIPLVWAWTPFLDGGDINVGSASGNAGNWHGKGQMDGTSAAFYLHGNASYTGPGYTAVLTVNITTAINSDPNIGFGVNQDGINIFFALSSSFIAGVGVYVFNIPIGPGVNSVLEFYGDYSGTHDPEADTMAVALAGRTAPPVPASELAFNFTII